MDRWQTGDCGAYAVAFKTLVPEMQYGALGDFDGEFFSETHHFVHDSEYAYDSLGKHALPYRGIDGNMYAIYGQDSWYYDEPHPDDVSEAIRHIRLTHGV